MYDTILGIYKKYKEVILYLVFGVSTTIVNWLIYIGVVKVSNTVVVANAIAWIGAVIFAYITNKIFVFESKSTKLKDVVKEAVSFFIARICSGIFEIFGPGVLMAIGLKQEIFGVKGFAAKIAISVLVVIMNYVLSKLFVFREKKDLEQNESYSQ
ncbi:MAG: GtrA family protein [bacterium]|nr:GtrA family protein [bacterium]